jgi:hypothetical protein
MICISFFCGVLPTQIQNICAQIQNHCINRIKNTIFAGLLRAKVAYSLPIITIICDHYATDFR